MVLALTRPAVHGRLIGLTGGTGEGEVGDQNAVIPAEKLAAMVADRVDPTSPFFPGVALRAFPGHCCLPLNLPRAHAPGSPGV